MRCQDVHGGAAHPAPQALGEQQEGAGVENGGQRPARRPVRRRPRVRPVAVQRPDHHGVELGAAHDVGRVGARPDDEGLAAAGRGHDLGTAGQDEVLHAVRRAQAHHSGSAAHGRRGGQDGGPGVGPAAGPQPDHAAGVLVVGVAGDAQEAPEVGVDGPRGQDGVGVGGNRQAEVDHLDAPAGAGRGRQDVGALEAGEGDRQVRRQDGAGHGAVVHAGARGQVDRHDPEGPLPPSSRRRQGRHQSGRAGAQGAGRADAGQAVDDQGGPAGRGAFAGRHGVRGRAHAGAPRLLQRVRVGVIGGQRRGDRAAAPGQQGARQQRVAAVVPAADQEEDAAAGRTARGAAQLAHGGEREGVGGQTHVAVRRGGQVAFGPGDGLGAVGGARRVGRRGDRRGAHGAHGPNSVTGRRPRASPRARSGRGPVRSRDPDRGPDRSRRGTRPISTRK